MSLYLYDYSIWYSCKQYLKLYCNPRRKERKERKNLKHLLWLDELPLRGNSVKRQNSLVSLDQYFLLVSINSSSSIKGRIKSKPFFFCASNNFLKFFLCANWSETWETLANQQDISLGAVSSFDLNDHFSAVKLLQSGFKKRENNRLGRGAATPGRCVRGEGGPGSWAALTRGPELQDSWF